MNMDCLYNSLVTVRFGFFSHGAILNKAVLDIVYKSTSMDFICLQFLLSKYLGEELRDCIESIGQFVEY